MARLTMMMMMGLMVGVAVCQLARWPPAPDFQWQSKGNDMINDIISRNKQNELKEIFFLDPSNIVNAHTYDQMYVSNEEIKAACEGVSSRYFVKSGTGGAFAPHPKTCFWKLQCAAKMLNDFRENTVYTYGVKVVELAMGEYFDPKTRVQAIWSTDNNCAAVNPCKTGRSMPTGRACNEYVTCVTDANGQKSYRNEKCPQGYAFNIYTSNCQLNSPRSCQPLNITETTTLYCKATGRPADIPVRDGFTDSSYFNETYKIDATGEIVTVRQVCPATLIFDPNDKNSTENCLCKKASEGACVNNTLIYAGVNTPQSWSNAIDLASFRVTIPTTGIHRDWARFERNVDFNYFDAQALAGNELSKDWSLSFGFQLEQNKNPSEVVLTQNSHTQIACPTPSLKVSVVNGNSIRAQVITKDISTGSDINNNPVTVQVDNNVNLANGKTQVTLERKGYMLKLSVRFPNTNIDRTAVATGLGRGPLAATRCGLIFGKDFYGWLESVKMVRTGC